MEQYRILEKLNSGSMGTVFKLLRLRDSAVLVLKRIPLLDLTDEQRDQAKLEVELMKQLHHPHIHNPRETRCDALGGDRTLLRSERIEVMRNVEQL